MRKIAVCIVLFLVILATYLAVSPFDENEKVYRIGILQFTKNNVNTIQGFKDKLAELGYVEGKNVRYISSGPIFVKSELRSGMSRLLAADPDLIFVSPTPAAIVARMMTEDKNIPVVFAPVNDPVSSGVVENIRSPEANVTGVRLSASDGRRLQSFKDVVPSIKNVFVPYSPVDKSSEISLRMLDGAAPKVGVTLIKKPFYSDTDVFADGYIPSGIDAILLPRDGRVMSRIRDFSKFCLEYKLPLSTPRYIQVKLGALTGYGFNGYDLGQQSARMSHRILSGRPVSSVSVETSKDYLFVNLKTARQIGIKIPDSILRQAHNIVR